LFPQRLAFPAQACWRRLFSRFDRQNSEKWAKIHFAIDPAKRNAYKHPDTSATTDR